MLEQTANALIAKSPLSTIPTMAARTPDERFRDPSITTSSHRGHVTVPRATDPERPRGNEDERRRSAEYVKSVGRITGQKHVIKRRASHRDLLFLPARKESS